MKSFNPLNYVILGVTLVAIVAVFFLAGPVEKTNIFYLNMGLACYVDILLLGSIFIVTKRENYTVQGIAVANQVLKYCVWLILIMIAYNVLINYYDLDLKWYIAVIIILTVLYFVFIAFLFQAGKAQVETAEKVVRINENKKNVIKSIPQVHVMLSEVIIGKETDIMQIERVKRSVKVLYDTATFVPADLYIQNTDLATSVLLKFKELEAKIKGTSDVSEKEAVQEHLDGIDALAKSICEYIRSNK